MSRFLRWSPVLAALIALLTGCLPHSLESTEVGVRTVRFALIGQTGVVAEPYAAGQTYFFAPFVNQWTVFDVGLQNLAMTTSADEPIIVPASPVPMGHFG